MWVEKVSLENIKCFGQQTIDFGTANEKYKWVTLLGENGGGKSTVLQVLALLLAGPEGATQLLKPEGWLRDEKIPGKIGARIHQGNNDPGKFGGNQREHRVFQYEYLITGGQKLQIYDKNYNTPAIVESISNASRLAWLRENALLPRGKGWFAAGYGAFRRLTRKTGQINLPAMQTPERFTNFRSQFEEDDALTAFEQWLLYLDVLIARNSTNGQRAERQRDTAIAAINSLLPEGTTYGGIDEDLKIWFSVNGNKVATLGLADGYRSVLALAGDLVWRLIEAFPESSNPLEEEGVVLIDELDIHLHPTWQRNIAGWLQSVFPNIQFIVATHSPLIAAGAGAAAKTYRLEQNPEGSVSCFEVENIAFRDVDSILQGDAFGLASTYSTTAEETMKEYLELKNKQRSATEDRKFQQLSLYAKEMFKPNHGYSDEDQQLRANIIEYLKSKMAQ
jgi:energy-coupling factor transporter ATP-binding protein EcfA2